MVLVWFVVTGTITEERYKHRTLRVRKTVENLRYHSSSPSLQCTGSGVANNNRNNKRKILDPSPSL